MALLSVLFGLKVNEMKFIVFLGFEILKKRKIGLGLIASGIGLPYIVRYNLPCPTSFESTIPAIKQRLPSDPYTLIN